MVVNIITYKYFLQLLFSIKVSFLSIASVLKRYILSTVIVQINWDLTLSE